MLKGLKMFDDQNERIVNESWIDTYDGKWITRDIPPGYEIIGVKCAMGEKAINRLGFMLWHPPSRPTKKAFKFTGKTS